MSDYEYQNGDEIYGPVSGQELKRLATRGDINVQTLIAAVNGAHRNWVKAASIPSIASIITDKQIESAVEQDQATPKTTYRPEPKGPLTEDDIVRAMARSKSYTTHAVVALLLCTFAIVPGFIAACAWYQDGKRVEEITVQPVPGVTALGFIAAISGILVVVVALVALLLVVPK